MLSVNEMGRCQTQSGRQRSQHCKVTCSAQVQSHLQRELKCVYTPCLERRARTLQLCTTSAENAVKSQSTTG